jgi:hypothetical protein
MPAYTTEELLTGFLCQADNEKLPKLIMDPALNKAYLDSILKKGKERPAADAALRLLLTKHFPKANRVFLRPPSREEVERIMPVTSTQIGVAGFLPKTTGTSS